MSAISWRLCAVSSPPRRSRLAASFVSTGIRWESCPGPRDCSSNCSSRGAAGTACVSSPRAARATAAAMSPSQLQKGGYSLMQALIERGVVGDFRALDVQDGRHIPERGTQPADQLLAGVGRGRAACCPREEPHAKCVPQGPAWLKAERETPTRFAARVKLHSSATARKARGRGPLDPATYRNHIAGNARNASDAVAPCPALPALRDS